MIETGQFDGTWGRHKAPQMKSTQQKSRLPIYNKAVAM